VPWVKTTFPKLSNSDHLVLKLVGIRKIAFFKPHRVQGERIRHTAARAAVT